MAPACISFKAAAAPASISAGARRRPAAAAVFNRAVLSSAAPLLIAAPAFFAASKRTTVLMRSSDSGEKNDDKLVTDSGEIMQGRQEMKTGPMSEDKQAKTPEQGGAPEGDRAAAAQPKAQQGDASAAEGGDKESAAMQSLHGAAEGQGFADTESEPAKKEEGQQEGRQQKEEGRQQDDKAPKQTFFAASKRTTVLMRSSDSGEKNDDKLVTDSGEIMQGRGAPEGDRAIAGQAAQPTGEQQGEAGEKAAGSDAQGAK
ncbi:hypothetical protein COO60DRAFT_1702473 [Scenedesmus sp. NREL 46B-D3]|nr:hypothetical protein COO60DRAFT_1702473 [Scenedesmus sp. NREL 46B-D3]